MPTTEHTINDAVAALLRTTRHAWKDSEVVRSENTGMLKGSSKRPDILIIEPSVSPVCIETEIVPAATLEAEARARLGEQLKTNGRTILSCIAVRIPAKIASKQGHALSGALSDSAELEMALFSGSSPTNFVRWPGAGWMTGRISDLSVLAQAASLPPEVIELAADELVAGVSEAAGMMEEMSAEHPAAIHKISEALKQHDGEQTRRMAATILANAFVFQGSLAGGPGELGEIASIEELRDEEGKLKQAVVLAEWRKILTINYWPIFDIARRILTPIPAKYSKVLIERLAKTAEKLLENRLMRSHDLTGAVFQRLIADRKFLAAYYTTPASAALVAGLVISPEKPSDKGGWDNAEAVKALRIADFACGTGTLLSAAYQRVGQLHELAGGDSEAIHPAMMGDSLVGCDILPAAAHLTASMLAGAHPGTKYTKSSILIVGYGLQENGDISLGSLDLLDAQGRFDILAITAKAAEGMGESERQTWASLPHGTFDVVIMNPPFTRPTGQHEFGDVGVPNPMFAAFNSDEEEQEMMSEATKRLTRGTTSHGNAGQGTIFLVLGDRKVKAKGMLGLILPVSLLSGDAWEGSRQLLRRQYRELIVMSIAGVEGGEVSFSADTNMAECVVVGRKDYAGGSTRAVFVVLKRSPGSPLVGANCTRQIRELIASGQLRKLEEGPLGGTPLYFGDDEIGQVVDAPLPESGGWNLSRMSDIALGQSAYQLAEKHRIWLPGMTEAETKEIAITTVGKIARIGPLHRDINGKGSGGAIRGPFKVAAIRSQSPTYPMLWSHNADRERTMKFDPDSEGTPLRGSTPAKAAIIAEKVAAIVDTAAHCHFNCDFRFNSQSTAMQFTPRKAIGGRAWISVQMTTDQEKALVVWANTSLGLLLHWWHANKPQPGRGNIGRSTLDTLPTLDVKKLSAKQLAAAVKVFDEMCETELLTFHQLNVDLNRHELDRRFCEEVLELPAKFSDKEGPLDLMRMKLAEEPSVRGHKPLATEEDEEAAEEEEES